MTNNGKDFSKRGTGRKICFFFYFVLLEIIAVGCLAISAFALVNESVIKLRIWEWFDNTIPNFPPIIAIIAACLMIITPIVGTVGVVRNNQRTIMVFMSLITLVGLLWLGIGAWGVSLNKLIMGDISIRFDRLERLGAGDIDEQNFLKDLREYMPRLSNNNNFLCCQGSENSPDNSLYICAQDCGDRYESLFRIVVFPAFYSVTFGAGIFCLLSILYGCLVSCHLDDVNPTF